MGKFYDAIPPELVPWLLKQELFWVATAPLSPDGHVNVSPKGVRDSFHVLDAHRVWYQDLTGSGAETVAHVRENGRVTLMFSAFEGPPRIVRLFGTGTIHEFGTKEYERLVPPEQRRPGSRAAIVVDVHKVGSSCGYAVPYYKFQGHRQALLDYFAKQEAADDFAEGSLKAYWAKKNLQSIDGIPALRDAPNAERVPGNGVSNVGSDGRGTGAAKVDGRRVQEWVVAFALGLAAAAAYIQVVGAVSL
ncbi:uncharacterized protein BXZ73DRAFT_92995 [Epithele typhae]|uniref:uncharacterized protein n=1 Tax=Epithele typhae TaxID=378194 RepID=UPI0020083DA1|nr:uncharacterized protein BXZ73DRAFT_92995 [Epithele typhae]KAH9913134.1 hypothetical protein BXZ73DRAFT_92995 [Epithele typhae]